MTTINKIAKVGILSGLLMGAVSIKATNPITNVNKTPNQNQTEVVSKEGATALRATSLQRVQQSTVPTVHNQKLDDTFRKFADNAESLKQINDILKSIYDNYGTFLASAQIQHELDRQQLLILLNKNTKMLAKINPQLAKEVQEMGPDFYKGINEYGNAAEKWLNEKYTPAILNFLTENQKPTAQELSRKLDYIAENKVNFNSDDILYYRIEIGNFKKRVINDKNDNMSLSSLIAHKMFIIDKIIMKKTLKNCNLFDNYSDISLYYDEWMDSVSQSKK